MKNPPNTISGIGMAFVDDNLNLMRQLLSAERVPVFVEVEVAVPHLRPAWW
jgi:hypothetical protein